MTIAIDTDLGFLKYEHPLVTLQIADALKEAEFAEESYLRGGRLRIAAAPEFDHAQLTYEYGRIRREDGTGFEVFPPLDITGKFVKLTIPATVTGDEDLVWYGKVASNSRKHHGTGDDESTPTGFQIFQCFGILWLLDQQPILKTMIDEGYNDPLEISEGLHFDSDQAGGLPGRGNRSTVSYANAGVDGAHYVFSNKARGAENWDAHSAVNYLLQRLTPVNAGGVAANTWALADGTDARLLNWYNVAVRTHGRTVKQVLDELMPRQRGVGYYARFEPADDTCRIHVFTFTDADLTLPSGAVLKANPDTRSLDFDRAVDVDADVSDVSAGQFHRVVCEGERRTTTLTQSLNTGLATNFFEQDWQASEETVYKKGASEEFWYAALKDDAEKQLANATARVNPKLKHVFTRFRMNKAGAAYRNRPFLQMKDGYNDNGAIKTYWLAPSLTAEPFDPLAPEPFPDRNGYLGNPVWTAGVRFLRQLPLYDRYDYTGANIPAGPDAWKAAIPDLDDAYDQPDFMKPFAFAQIQVSDGNTGDRFVPLDHLHETAFNTDNGRTWSAGLEISTTDPAILLAVRPNQFLAKTRWAEIDPAATADEQNPALNGGLDPSQIWVTITAELPERVRAEKTLTPPPPGAPESVLRFEVPDARCDWVCPYTVVEIRNGQLKKTTTGGFVRDDRNRLKDIARSAAEWYGKDRQTLVLRYKTLRNLFQLGWLITEFGSLQKTGVNTPVTAIDFSFGHDTESGTTTIQTSYAQLDFSQSQP